MKKEDNYDEYNDNDKDDHEKEDDEEDDHEKEDDEEDDHEKELEDNYKIGYDEEITNYMNDPTEISLPVHINKKIVAYTIVSKKHEELLKNKYLSMSQHGYALFKKKYLHRFITNAEDERIDHINQNKLDNSDSNLRIVTHSQNSHNWTRIKSENSTSIYRGVCKMGNLWNCSIKKNKISYTYSFTHEMHAAYYYDELCRKHYGEQNSVMNNIPKPNDFTGPNINLRSIKTTPLGVTYDKSNNTYVARITINGKKINLGRFDTVDKAIIARKKAETDRDVYIKEQKHKIGTNIVRNIDNIAIIIIKSENKDDVNVLIDDDMYYDFANHNWYLTKGGYVTRSDNITMHTLVTELNFGPKPDPTNIIDHINRNKLDNRSINLRYVTSAVNNHNKTKMKNATSIYKGVIKTKCDRWDVNILCNGIKYHCGSFICEHEAGEAYNTKAKELYKDNAYLNIIIIPEGYIKPIIKSNKNIGI
jgi:hypothetical protein